MKFPTEAAERVARILAENGPCTASALADELGTSTTAVRRPLGALHEAGLVEASERAPYGPDPGPRRGRPSRVFSLTGAGRAACEQAYDALALEALRFLAERDGRAAVAEFAADRADRLLAGVGSSTTAVAAVHEVAERLTEQGFAASVEPLTRDGAQLCQHSRASAGASRDTLGNAGARRRSLHDPYPGTVRRAAVRDLARRQRDPQHSADRNTSNHTSSHTSRCTG